MKRRSREDQGAQEAFIGRSGLTWDKVDLEQGAVRLDPGETKNEKGRTLYIERRTFAGDAQALRQKAIGMPLSLSSEWNTD